MTDSATVLVVDNERGLVELYESWLDDDYDIRTAYSGEETLDQLDETVDVVLLDRRMPDLSGDEVIARLREQGCDCWVAMVSAVEPDFDIIDAKFEDYVSKPVSKDDLRETVDRMATLATSEQNLREYYALVSKKAALDAVKSASEIESSDDYSALEANIDDLTARLDVNPDLQRFLCQYGT